MDRPLGLEETDLTLASIGGSTWLGMKPHPYVLTACVKRPGVLIRHDQASLACTLGLIAFAKAYERGCKPCTR
jgi:hypothetical protein